MHSVCCTTVTYRRSLRAITPCHITNARQGADETESEVVLHCWTEERRKPTVRDGKSWVKAIIAHEYLDVDMDMDSVMIDIKYCYHILQVITLHMKGYDRNVNHRH